MPSYRLASVTEFKVISTKFSKPIQALSYSIASCFMPHQSFPILDLLHQRVTTSQALFGLSVGFDIVQISQMEGSLRAFGETFTKRLFTPDELIYANCDEGLFAERLAARFAAKEAVIKALQLSELGVDWRDIEVIKKSDGDCYLQLHGQVSRLALSMGAMQWLLSMSHDGDYAGAVVMALGVTPNPQISELSTKVKYVGIH
jgi:holo-[acyl-carrier protein] synthase